MAEYQQDFTFEEVLDEDGYPVHSQFNMTLENSITGDVYSKVVTFTADPV